jgi:hypothetical protein
MKAQNINIQVFGMMDLLTGVFGDEAEQVLEDSKVYSNFTFGDCDYSLVSVESFIDSFTGEAFDALWNEIKVSLRIPGEDPILPEDVANLYVNLVG